MDKSLPKIEACGDPKLLRQWIKNGTIKGEDAIVRAARVRLFRILPAAGPGSLEHDVWLGIHAPEELEAIALRHRDQFSAKAISNAEARMDDIECGEKPAASVAWRARAPYSSVISLTLLGRSLPLVRREGSWTGFFFFHAL